jgi:hypothetical protein
VLQWLALGTATAFEPMSSLPETFTVEEVVDFGWERGGGGAYRVLAHKD